MIRNRRGFTIVELIIVIAIVAVLAGVLVPVLSNVIQNANKNAAMQDMSAEVKLYIIQPDVIDNLKEDDCYIATENKNDTWYASVIINNLLVTEYIGQGASESKAIREVNKQWGDDGKTINGRSVGYVLKLFADDKTENLEGGRDNVHLYPATVIEADSPLVPMIKEFYLSLENDLANETDSYIMIYKVHHEKETNDDHETNMIYYAGIVFNGSPLAYYGESEIISRFFEEGNMYTSTTTPQYAVINLMDTLYENKVTYQRTPDGPFISLTYYTEVEIQGKGAIPLINTPHYKVNDSDPLYKYFATRRKGGLGNYTSEYLAGRMAYKSDITREIHYGVPQHKVLDKEDTNEQVYIHKIKNIANPAVPMQDEVNRAQAAGLISPNMNYLIAFDDTSGGSYEDSSLYTNRFYTGVVVQGEFFSHEVGGCNVSSSADEDVANSFFKAGTDMLKRLQQNGKQYYFNGDLEDMYWFDENLKLSFKNKSGTESFLLQRNTLNDSVKAQNNTFIFADKTTWDITSNMTDGDPRIAIYEIDDLIQLTEIERAMVQEIKQLPYYDHGDVYVYSSGDETDGYYACFTWHEVCVFDAMGRGDDLYSAVRDMISKLAVKGFSTSECNVTANTPYYVEDRRNGGKINVNPLNPSASNIADINNLYVDLYTRSLYDLSIDYPTGNELEECVPEVAVYYGQFKVS